ncbi:BZ3501_MvSof-1269-A2-R1_Chr12-3g03609 [Microbotryum saponariae]|nr:BZ3501_MvSof-1269-A2-R1_Chr12-3g03609 [Microbotryum saponariae]
MLCILLAQTRRFENNSRGITQRYQDAMACVVKYGKPSLFITVTCNPKWPEIKAALGPNDEARSRPDLIARVFEAKLTRLCDGFWATSNGQAGLPHAHILHTLAPDDHSLSTEAIDKVI